MIAARVSLYKIVGGQNKSQNAQNSQYHARQSIFHIELINE